MRASMTEASPLAERDVALCDGLVALYPAMRRFAACAADSDLDPDDLVQEAFTRVFRQAQQTVPDDLGAYVRRSIVNLIANERRSRMRARDARQRTADSAQGAEGADVSYPSHTVAILESASPIDRALVYLVDVEGFPIGEAAAMVGLSHVAARARLSRARRRLQAALVDEHRNAADHLTEEPSAASGGGPHGE